MLGGADTNFLRSHGINCLTLGNGYRDTHTFQESISVRNLENMARMTVSMIYGENPLDKCSLDILIQEGSEAMKLLEAVPIDKKVL